jgi:hypothetical protein
MPCAARHVKHRSLRHAQIEGTGMQRGEHRGVYPEQRRQLALKRLSDRTPHPSPLNGHQPRGNKGYSRRSSEATPPERGPLQKHSTPARGGRSCHPSAQNGSCALAPLPGCRAIASGSGGVAGARPPYTTSDASGIRRRRLRQQRAPRDKSATHAKHTRRAIQATGPPPPHPQGRAFGTPPQRAAPGWDGLGLRLVSAIPCEA